MRGIKLTLLFLVKDLKNTLYFLLSSTIIFAAMFSIFNIICDLNFNPVSSGLSPEISDARLSFGLITVFILICLSIISSYSNNFFMTRRKKEIAIELLSGMSINSLALNTAFQNLIFSLLSCVLGAILGFFISALLNPFLYNLLEIQNSTFSVTKDAFFALVGVSSINVMLLGLINVGLGYRTEIIDLVKDKFKEYKPKKTKISLFKIVTIFIFLGLPILNNLFEKTFSGSFVLILLHLAAFIFFINTFMPYYLDKKIRKAKDMIQIIYLTNIKVNLEDSTPITMCILCFTAFLSYSISFFKTDIFSAYKGISISFILGIVLSFAILYKFISSASSNCRRFKTLISLGYQPSYIKKIVLLETLFYCAILFSSPILFTISCLFSGIKFSIITLSFSLSLLGLLILVFLFSFILSYFSYKKIVYSKLLNGGR